MEYRIVRRLITRFKMNCPGLRSVHILVLVNVRVSRRHSKLALRTQAMIDLQGCTGLNRLNSSGHRW
ncbi:hypothetical protein BJV77DRAFT_1007019 [Russula vinacea]|nr:hypothetical protein BJV77DRAFT_1007019 [Russula vinacea]